MKMVKYDSKLDYILNDEAKCSSILKVGFVEFVNSCVFGAL